MQLAAQIDGYKRTGMYVMMILLELNHIDTIYIGLELANGRMSDKQLLDFILELMRWECITPSRRIGDLCGSSYRVTYRCQDCGTTFSREEYEDKKPIVNWQHHETEAPPEGNSLSYSGSESYGRSSRLLANFKHSSIAAESAFFSCSAVSYVPS